MVFDELTLMIVFKGTGIAVAFDQSLLIQPPHEHLDSIPLRVSFQKYIIASVPKADRVRRRVHFIDLLQEVIVKWHMNRNAMSLPKWRSNKW